MIATATARETAAKIGIAVGFIIDKETPPRSEGCRTANVFINVLPFMTHRPEFKTLYGKSRPFDNPVQTGRPCEQTGLFPASTYRRESKRIKYK